MLPILHVFLVVFPQDLTFDYHNNGIYLTKLPASSSSSGSASKVSKRGKGTPTPTEAGAGGGAEEQEQGGDDADSSARSKPSFVHPHDRFGKVLPKRFTTNRVRALRRETDG